MYTVQYNILYIIIVCIMFYQYCTLTTLTLAGADYVVRLLPGEAPFQDTLPPSYSDSIIVPREFKREFIVLKFAINW